MDTAQPFAAAETDDPNVQLQNAADAFKAVDNPVADRPRAADGRFASAQEDEPPVDPEDHVEGEAEAEPETEAEEIEEDEQEAADEAQPMPPSWPADKADEWAQLPAATQGFIAEREAERERAVNAKFQESANARKEASLAQREAQTKRDEYLQALETVEGLYTTPKPDPRAFGYGTQQYNAAAFATALAEYEHNAGILAQFKEQREAIAKEAAEEESKAFAEWRQEHEAQHAPKLLADVPELKDPAKGEPLLRELFGYAVEHGIPEDTFSNERLKDMTSAELHILWKARQFDKLKVAKVTPKPRQAGPSVRPGVSSPRSAQKVARTQKAHDRLAREGSIEAGAAVWKQFL